MKLGGGGEGGKERSEEGRSTTMERASDTRKVWKGHGEENNEERKKKRRRRWGGRGDGKERNV